MIKLFCINYLLLHQIIFIEGLKNGKLLDNIDNIPL